MASSSVVSGPAQAGDLAGRSRYVARFGRSERVLHWLNATCFFALLGSGLVLYLPFLASIFGNRPVTKAVHLVAAVTWLTGVILIAILGDNKQLRRTRQELERFDSDDLLFLKPGRGAKQRRAQTLQGRFNAAQKAHAIVQAAFMTVFFVTGALLWLGERNTSFRFGGTIATHDLTMFVAVGFVAIHLYLALLHPKTSPSLRGMLRGSVDRAWAALHHAKWQASPAFAAEPVQIASLPRLALAAVVFVIGVGAATWLARDTASKGDGGGEPAVSTSSSSTSS